MTTRCLSRLLAPASVAVVGGGWGRNVLAQLRKSDYQGTVWPVHPTATEIEGWPCFSSIEALPAAPDATFLAINRHATIEALAQLSAMGAGGAIAFASGFAEVDAEGPALQMALADAAGSMPVLGPNCYGLLNYLDAVPLWPDQHGGQRVERGVALLTQSSNIALNLTMQARGLPIAFVGTLGNQAQISMAELGMAMLDRAEVTALGLYIEGISDIAAWEALSTKARDLGKPIVALKSGRSEAAQQAALSHTASIVGTQAAAQALLQRLGLIEVRSLSVMLETLKILHVYGRLGSNRVVSMSCSGGEAGLVADTGDGLAFPPLGPEQKARLAALLGPLVALANPLDYHTFIWHDVAQMTACFTLATDMEIALGMLVLDFPRDDRCSAEAWGPALAALKATQTHHQKPMAVISSLPETLPETTAQALLDAQIVPLAGLETGLAAVKAAATPLPPKPLPVLRPSPLGRAVHQNEAQAKIRLKEAGLDLPWSVTADSVLGLTEKAQQAPRWPVVLKDITQAHKSEHGGVALGLSSSDDVALAAKTMVGNVFLLEEQITDGLAEVLVGIQRDPAHGYALTLGAGGTLTEVLSDTRTLMIPSPREQIADALASLRIYPLLTGYRGKPAANLAALLDLIEALQAFTIAHADRLSELEINPVICTSNRAVIVDALMQWHEPPDPEELT